MEVYFLLILVVLLNSECFEIRKWNKLGILDNFGCSKLVVDDKQPIWITIGKSNGIPLFIKFPHAISIALDKLKGIQGLRTIKFDKQIIPRVQFIHNDIISLEAPADPKRSIAQSGSISSSPLLQNFVMLSQIVACFVVNVCVRCTPEYQRCG